MMGIEVIIADLYTARCEGMTGYALFDGGAHRAYHTVRMANLPGCDHVYAIEADPSMALVCKAILEEECPEKLDRIDVIQKALQRDPDTSSIAWKSSTSHIGRSSIVSVNPEKPTIWSRDIDIKYRHDMLVQATTIDTILENDARDIPFIKLDLEGADIMSLMGAERTLSQKRPIVAFENSVHSPEVHGFTIEEFQDFLFKIDYVPVNFLGQYMTSENWFGFFEAWLAPREWADWLSRSLKEISITYVVPPQIDSEEQSMPPEGGFRHRILKPFLTGKKNPRNETETLVTRSKLYKIPPAIEISAGNSARTYSKRGLMAQEAPGLVKSILKNLSEKVIEGSSPDLPAETRTEGWRELSADVAWVFWSNPDRVEQIVEKDTPVSKWDETSADYRARIRSVMRSLVVEKLSFKQLYEPRTSHEHDQKWMLDTGRFAWLLWLSAWREVNPADEAVEQRLWKSEADSYRKYVRDSLLLLEEKGIVFAE